MILELWNLREQTHKFFEVSQIHCVVHGDIRVELLWMEDPVFLKTKDDMILYEGKLYSDYSCYPAPPEWSEEIIPVEMFNINEAI